MRTLVNVVVMSAIVLSGAGCRTLGKAVTTETKDVRLSAEDLQSHPVHDGVSQFGYDSFVALAMCDGTAQNQNRVFMMLHQSSRGQPPAITFAGWVDGTRAWGRFRLFRPYFSGQEEIPNPDEEIRWDAFWDSGDMFKNTIWRQEPGESTFQPPPEHAVHVVFAVGGGLVMRTTFDGPGLDRWNTWMDVPFERCQFFDWTRMTRLFQ